jgi:dUTP pyrophosphatase
MLIVKKFDKDAVLPVKGRIGDAGWDLSSVEDVIIPPQSWKLVNTGIGFTVPDGTYGRIAPRSGVSTKGISVNAGVIDKTYTGIVKVLLVNHSLTDAYEVKKYNKIAQLILEKIIENCEILEVDSLDETERGIRGFGSSGI